MKTNVKTSCTRRFLISQTPFQIGGRRQPVAELPAVAGETKSDGGRSQTEFGNEGKQCRRSAKTFFILLVAGWAGTCSCAAATSTWNVSTSGGWGTAGNWSPSGVPASGSDIVFSSSTGTGSTKTITLDAARSINSLTFNATQTGAVTINGGGNFTLTLSPSSAGGTSLNVDTNSGDHSVTTLVSLAAQNNQVFSIGANRAFSFTNTISGSTATRAFTKSGGTGTLVLSGANTYSGGTTLSAGTIALGSSGLITASAITSGPVGTGTLTIGTGTTLRSDGTTGRAIENNLSLSGSITLGDATNSGALIINSTVGSTTLTTATTVALTADTALTVNSSVLIANAITGAFSLTKSGAGTLTLGASNAYSGTTTITGGTLSINATGTLGANPSSASNNVFINGGTLQITGADYSLSANRNFVLGSSTGSGTGTIEVTSGVTLTVPGVIKDNGSGSGALTKIGTGTLTLSGANTFTGTTTINAGTLQASAGTLISTSRVTVNSGGTLLLAGSGRHIGANTPVTLNGGIFNTGGVSEPGTSGQTIGALTLQSSSTINLGTGASVLAFADSSASTWAGTLSILNWSGTVTAGVATSGGTDQLHFGISTLAAGITTNQLGEIQFVNPDGFAPGSYAAMFAAGDLSEIVPNGLVPVPEPATWLAGALALGTLGWSQRRRLGAFGAARRRLVPAA